jgi:ankyrin repeat protein
MRVDILAKHTSQWRNTALMWAAENGFADCARLLLDAGANTEAQSWVRVGPPHLRLDARVWVLVNIMFATAIGSIYFILIFTIAHRSDNFLFWMSIWF